MWLSHVMSSELGERGGVCLPGWLGLWLVVFVSETESQVAQDSLELTIYLCDLRLLTLLGLLPKPGVTGVHHHTKYCSMLGLNPGIHVC